MSDLTRAAGSFILSSLLSMGGFAIQPPSSSLATDDVRSDAAGTELAAEPGLVSSPELLGMVNGSLPTGKFIRPEAILFDNGPLVTHPGGGSGGADASALQTALGNSTYGFGHAVSSGFRVADDFTVPAGGWNISQITFFAYQTGSTTTTTINHVNLRIWDGPPGQGGSNIVFGDTTTNRLAGSSFSNIYRVLDTGLLDTARPTMADVATVGTTLAAGTYWLDWQTGGTLASGPWAPPVTLLGQVGKPGANGQQYSPTTGLWSAAIDTGNGSAQDFPFIIEGTVASGPSISLAKTVGTTAGVCATTSAITVDEGTTVYYCYEVTNTGTVALTTHDLADDQLGTIFTGLAYNLTPGSSVNTVQAGLSIPAVINATTTNVGTWTAHDAAGAPTVATDSATVTAIPPRCPAGYSEVTVLSQDFTGSFPPAGWVLANSTTGCVAPGVPDWTNTDPGARGNLTGGAGSFAIADSDACGSTSIMNAQIWSPVLNLTGLTDPEVSYYTDYNDISLTSDLADLDFSTNGGGAWTNLLSWNEDHRGPLQIVQPFAADNQANTVLRWNYINATWDWWWQIDQVVVTACEPAGCTLTPPANIVVGNDPGTCGAVVSFVVGASGSCGTVTCTPPSGSTFPVGPTVVNCTSSVGGGATSFSVTVNDVELPSITCPADVVGDLPPGSAGENVFFPDPTVGDNCPGVGAPSCVPASGDFFPAGQTSVLCEVIDAAGNLNSCNFNVTLGEVTVLEVPTVSGPGLLALALLLGGAAFVLLRRRSSRAA